MTRWLPEDVKRIQKRLAERDSGRVERPTVDSTERVATQLPPKSPRAVLEPSAASRLNKAKREAARDAFILQCVAYGLPKPDYEFKFHPNRGYRWDFCWIRERVAIEVQGGLWSKGRAKAAHALPLGILRDYEKSNLGQEHGWTVLFFTPTQLRGALPQIKRVLGC